ncbi:cation:dicarboxylase symporter family transporter [Corynebacterium bovis]|uniref:cation:dicarboxylate symporter family transporter n=1 Tax=Corynebacterium bovis TaxID=36808 RepID=UPI00254ED250|nr:cation:dicarboxylase symporter family transporter [Corynebacterium bovis]MDK8509976.1 cation:dicarboxylase symporter family transporter [Corynebacterium bovis]
MSAQGKKDHTHWLYIGVIVAVILGVAFGLLFPDQGQSLKILGTMFVGLVKMMIAPIIFCTIVLGIGHVREAATVGRAGGIALVYFIVMSTFALAVGLVVGNIIKPGTGLDISGDGSRARALVDAGAAESQGFAGFISSIIPETMISSLTSGKILQTLFIALLVGFALQSMPERTAAPVLHGIELAQGVVFKVLSMVLWVAPVGTFGAMAAVVGRNGLSAVGSLLTLMLGFYVTCVIFIVVVLGGVLWACTRINILKLLRYLGREYLLIVGTSSSESALPTLMQKMQFVGVQRSTVGIVVPTGYSFNLDGTAIYLTMASIFIADGMGIDMGIGEQIGLLVFMIVASKGAAGVSGAGIATLAAGLQAHRPEMLGGVDVITGIDRFMSEARSLTNFTGNAVATLLVARWTGTLDRDRARQVLDREVTFTPEAVGAA